MKRFFRTLAFVAMAAVSVVSISSCKTDENDDDDNKKTNKNEQMTGATSEAFYNGLTNENNLASTILIDTRDAVKYKAGHIKYGSLEAINIPLSEDLFYANGSDHQFYKDVEALDPSHSKFILVTDEGSNSLILKATGVLSGMGWGKEKIYLLMDNTTKFLEKYPALDSSKQ